MELAAPVAHAARTDHRAARTTIHHGPVERPRPQAVQVEIVVPVYNEAHQLVERITTLREYLDRSLPFSSLVTIVDNGSTDGTPLVARRLAATVAGVQALTLTRKGRGYALRRAWEASTAEVVAYMDVDLSTSLNGLMPLVASVLSGHGDIAVGTRLARGSRVVRGPKRELISRAYSLLVRTSLRSRLSDFQCGFKALRRDRALQLLPLVEDEAWFFDTELLITAERLGMRITELPVEWVDDPDSRVHIISTAAEDLKGVWRISHGAALHQVRHLRGLAGPSSDQATSDQLLSFAGVGLLSTLSYLLLFALGSKALGFLVANAVALAFCTVVNTALHRSLASGRSDEQAPDGRRSHFLVTAGALYGVSLTFTTSALLVTHLMGAGSLAAALLAVMLANAAASLVRFALLRGWAFRPWPPPPAPRR
ncbi:MAG TPA: dolichyl-phosphate beta-glucosyltransferase [Acidimicrobiales bacterium]|jgi:putative flippase GtrA|nr:dolichyl-phosphate beta-glucosyltransferase [Acidimicrobiales bacterium]